MIIDPKIEISAKALIQLDADTAEGLIRLGFTSGRLTIPDNADQVATLSITLAAAETVDINFATFAQDGGAAAEDAEGVAVNFDRIYALGIKASDALSVATADGADPWVQAPLPSAAADLQSLCAVGEFTVNSGSNSALFTNSQEVSVTLEIIAIGLRD